MSRRHQRQRVEAFRNGGGIFDVSLMGTGRHRAIDSAAIGNWALRRAIERPTCFGCFAELCGPVQPGAFLTAAKEGDHSKVAVAALCARCWRQKPPERIEADALSLLRRQLCKTGRWL